MTNTVPISPWDGGMLFDQQGNLVGSYNKETGRGMLAHTFFVDERTCHMTHKKKGPIFDVYAFDCCGKEYPESRCDSGSADLPLEVCPYCGAKVVEQ